MDARRERYRVKECTVDECTNPHLAKGLCAKHYAQTRNQQMIDDVHNTADLYIASIVRQGRPELIIIDVRNLHGRRVRELLQHQRIRQIPVKVATEADGLGVGL